MIETYLNNQYFVWGAIGAVFILVSIIRKSFYPILAFALFYLAIVIKDTTGSERIAELLQNLLYVSIGVSLMLGYSFAMTGFRSTYLSPRDELRLIIYGVLFSLPGFLFLGVESLEILPYSYSLFAVTLGAVMLFFSGKVDRLLRSNESAYLDDANNRIQREGLISLKATFGDVSLSEMRKKVEEAFDRGEIPEPEYYEVLVEIHFLSQDYESTLLYGKEHQRLLQGNVGASKITRNIYIQAMSEEALGNTEQALEHYRYVEEKSNGNFYYVTQKLKEQKV
ncbi:hypothetical protein [Phaeodactylibacter sp.]|uniref:hypothetical protein n=1 Tax=Phaeodactylibacter sp. TaxID=1940289 RepID=UPI0025E3EAD7|nr:hypothetical protein [Phaeodactylibacter sp.]MCI5091153.1 hypothetical protein [Phaeodactylibacter sp.]